MVEADMRAQAALIAKGTVVALLGRMTLLPKEGREAVESGIGLVYMFSSLTISLVGLEIQALSAKRFLLGILSIHIACSLTTWRRSSLKNQVLTALWIDLTLIALVQLGRFKHNARRILKLRWYLMAQ